MAAPPLFYDGTSPTTTISQNLQSSHTLGANLQSSHPPLPHTLLGSFRGFMFWMWYSPTLFINLFITQSHSRLRR